MPDGRGARRRDLDAQRRTLDATLKVLRERGYARVTIEEVARRGRVSKATIYRWWSGKPELVAEAIATTLRRPRVPDTGDLRADLVRVVRETIGIYAGTAAGGAVVLLTADLAQDRRLLRAFRRRFLIPRRAGIREILERGMKRGQLPQALDVELVLDVWAGAILFRRLLSGQPIEPSLAGRLVDLVLKEVS